MKKIINGKLYNTETAIAVADFSNFGTWRDFAHFEETLYKKKTGEFFLYGEGGPMTKYCVTIGLNEWTGGEKITPLTIEDAKRWAEKHIEEEEYIKIFGSVEE